MKGFIHLFVFIAQSFGFTSCSFGFSRTRIEGFSRWSPFFIEKNRKILRGGTSNVWQLFSAKLTLSKNTSNPLPLKGSTFRGSKILLTLLRTIFIKNLRSLTNPEMYSPLGVGGCSLGFSVYNFPKVSNFWKVRSNAFLQLHIILFFTLIISCQKKQPREIKPAFYHWKTESTISESEKNYLKNLKVEKLYIRLFDIDWDETRQFPTPIASTKALENINKDIEIVPTLYFTNKTFSKLLNNQLDTLVRLVFQKIERNTEGGHFNEIQIDCDWTETTKTRFFSFLKSFKKLSKKQISATIRLHQVKYANKTGVPPVDRGTLMAYNMGNLDDTQTGNSILDTTILKSYLKNFENYPLKLDIALPLFSWGIVIRDGEAVKIINNLSDQDFGQVKDLKQGVDVDFQENRVHILKNLYLKGYYLYKDDEIRLENTPLSILQPTADLLAQHLNNEQVTVSFFHLDSAIIQRYHYEDLQDIIHRFH
jgi:hypothetical protein